MIDSMIKKLDNNLENHLAFEFLFWQYRIHLQEFGYPVLHFSIEFSVLKQINLSRKNNMIFRLIFGITLFTMYSIAIAGGAEGVWKTETSKDGGYLEVTIAACDTDSAKTCGKITKAYNKQGVDANFKNLGKLMVKDMTTTDGKNYSDGTIWDPENNKTYNSKMHLKGDDLDVKGCVSIFCSGQDWKRVK